MESVFTMIEKITKEKKETNKIKISKEISAKVNISNDKIQRNIL